MGYYAGYYNATGGEKYLHRCRGGENGVFGEIVLF
jgi:hypothetical protein